MTPEMAADFFYNGELELEIKLLILVIITFITTVIGKSASKKLRLSGGSQSTPMHAFLVARREVSY